MGSIPNKNEPKKPKITLDSANLGKRLKEYDELPDEPKKPTIKPTVIKPLLGEYDAIAKANTPKKVMPEPTVIKPLNNFNSSSLPQTQPKPTVTPNDNKTPKTKEPKTKTTPDDLADIWSEQEKIKLAREAEEKRQKAEKKAQKQAKKLAKKQKKQEAKKSGKPKELNINLKAPNLKNSQHLAKINKNFAGWSTKNKKAFWVGIALIMVPVGIIITSIIIKITDNTKKPATTTSVIQGQETKKADFAIITPNGTPNVTAKYDSNKKVVSYKDKIVGVNVTVSQQLLPESFKSDVDGNVRKMAEQFYANIPLEIKDGSAFLGTSIKGPQTVILNKNSLLIFLQSDQQIDKKAWIDYIDSLKLSTE